MFTLYSSSTLLFKQMRQIASTNNTIYRFWAFPIGVINIYNPEDIELVISHSEHNKKSFMYNFLHPWLKEGLLVSDGHKWFQRRKILTPTFHFNILRQFFVILEEHTRRMINTLDKYDGEAVDVIPLISEHTLQSICETAMGVRVYDSGPGKSYKAALHEMVLCLITRLVNLYLYPTFIYNYSLTGMKQRKLLKTIHKFTKDVIDERKKYVEKHGVVIDEGNTEGDDLFMNKNKKKIAMLDLLILAEKEGQIDSAGIQEEVDTFMFEGHDTTASGLSYCLMSLANHENVQDKIVLELNSIFGDSDRTVTMDDLSKMKYLECCIKESLRLYPPVPLIGRELNKSVSLCNFEIPKGTYCHIHLFDLHRREDLFKNATKFDPDRFLPENSVGRHPYSYIPFSAGPRNCIGQKFAMLEMKLLISSIMRKFRLLPVTTVDDLEFVADLVLKNNGPIYVKFEKRIH